MPSIRLDRVVFSTFHEAYKNHGTTTVTFQVSGSVPDGGKEFSTNLQLSRANTRADVYYTKTGGTASPGKRPMNAAAREVDFDGSTANIILRYNTNILTVGVYVNNFGGVPLAVSTQDYTVTVVEYSAPIAY